MSDDVYTISYRIDSMVRRNLEALGKPGESISDIAKRLLLVTRIDDPRISATPIEECVVEQTELVPCKACGSTGIADVPYGRRYPTGPAVQREVCEACGGAGVHRR